MMKTKQIRLMASAAVFLVLLGSGLAYYQYAYAVTRTWDGGGVDGTCGGAGTANNWTCAANWSGDTVPTGSDIASFDATSTKNATINAGISVAGISIAVGYTGTITQSAAYSVTVGSSHWVQAGGTFTGGSGTIDINGTYTLSGGTFTSTSGVFEVGRVAGSETIFALSSGTFNHNNGTVRFAPSDTCTFNTSFTVDIATSLTLYDVVVNAIQACGGANILTLASGDSVIITHDFTQTDGILGGIWELQNNIVIGANADGSKDSSTLTMTGTGAKTYTYTTGGIGPHLRINNAGLSVSANAGTTDLSVAYFSLLAGTFVAPTGILNVGAYDQTTGEIFVVSGGVFDHNRGIVSFVSASAYWTTFTINVPTSLTLYDVSWSPIAVNSSYLTTAAGDTLIVAHDFSHVRGILDGTWEVQGDYTVAAAAIGGTASIAFTGGNSQTYTNQGGDEANGDITVNKSGGAIALTSNADWNAAGQDVTVTAGTLSVGPGTLSTNAITVAAGATFQMTSSGDLTLASTLTNNGLVHIWGNDTCGGSDAVQIRSSSSGVQRSWNGTGTFSIYDADIQDMAGAAAITVYSSTNNGNNGANWTFSGAACPAAALTPAMTLGTGSFYLGSGVVNLR